MLAKKRFLSLRAAALVLMTSAPKARAKSMRPRKTSTASSRPRSMCEEKAWHAMPLSASQRCHCWACAGVNADSSNASV